jgi:DNA processing protein
MTSDYLPLMALINDKYRNKEKELFEIMDQFGANNNIDDLITIFNRLSTTNAAKIENEIDKNLDAYKWEISKLIASNVNIFSYFSDNYPKLLAKIKNPPLVLYHKGSLLNFEKCIAIVGTRNLSHYGHKMTHKISYLLANNGFSIVSGLARGVDTEAHLGALDANGKTIAVLPSSILDIYPKENTKLVEDILTNGAIISEISSLEKIQKNRFIERNRITSGISECVIVIETSDTGGTMHQIRIAKDQNKKIFVLKPQHGNLDALRGYNEILSCGGVAFESPEEILELLRRPFGKSFVEKKVSQNLSLFL